jgi:hypothetical protein
VVSLSVKDRRVVYAATTIREGTVRRMEIFRRHRADALEAAGLRE